VIWQSAVGHDWERSKTANQTFVTTPRWVGCWQVMMRDLKKK
jgi:hypothetical protein